MTVDEYQRLHPEVLEPTYDGQKADRGRIVVGEPFPNEGYAVVRCGWTEIQVSYTVLHNVMALLIPDQRSSMIRDQQVFCAAMRSITCEASLGRTGDA